MFKFWYTNVPPYTFFYLTIPLKVSTDKKKLYVILRSAVSYTVQCTVYVQLRRVTVGFFKRNIFKTLNLFMQMS